MNAPSLRGRCIEGANNKIGGTLRIVIFGSRGIEDMRTVECAMKACGMVSNVTEIVSGGARGVDRLGEHCPTARPALHNIPCAMDEIREKSRAYS